MPRCCVGIELVSVALVLTCLGVEGLVAESSRPQLLSPTALRGWGANQLKITEIRRAEAFWAERVRTGELRAGVSRLRGGTEDPSGLGVPGGLGALGSGVWAVLWSLGSLVVKAQESRGQETEGGGGHDHGHSHGDGGHGHAAHGHSHEAHSHGHSHGAHSHETHSHGHSHHHAHDQSPILQGVLGELFMGLQTAINQNPKSYAIAASALVSCSSLFVMPFMGYLKNGDTPVDINNSLLLKVLVSFAVGAMLGDVFLHMLPHSIQKVASNSVDQAMQFGLPVLIGMTMFYVAEKGMGALTGGAGHSHDVHSHHGPHGCGHGHEQEFVEAVVPCAETRGGKHVVRVKSGCMHKDGTVPGIKEKFAKFKKRTFEEICKRCESLVQLASSSATNTTLKPAALLNLLADMLHNFSDGLALGVNFGKGHGIVTTLAVFFHEVPHNIADFAILIQHGFSHGAALKAQFASALGALVGCIVGLYVRDFSGMEGFIAGGFIYIATVDLVPLMLQDTNLMTMLFEVLAMTLGVTMNIGMLHLENSVPGACVH